MTHFPGDFCRFYSRRKAVPVGSSVEVKNTGEAIFTTNSGNVVCGTATLKGSVTKNSSTKIEGTIPVGGAVYKGTGTGEDCTSTLFTNAPVGVTVDSELCLETVTGTDNINLTPE